jgi:shikimate kinase
MDWDRIYGVQQFVVFTVLAHLPLVVEASIPPALLAVWYVTMMAVAVLALVTNLGWPALAREYEHELGALEVGLCGVGCAVVAVVLLRSAAPTPYTYGLAAAAGLAAVALVGAGIRPYLTARRR